VLAEQHQPAVQRGLPRDDAPEPGRDQRAAQRHDDGREHRRPEELAPGRAVARAHRDREPQGGAREQPGLRGLAREAAVAEVACGADDQHRERGEREQRAARGEPVPRVELPAQSQQREPERDGRQQEEHRARHRGGEEREQQRLPREVETLSAAAQQQRRQRGQRGIHPAEEGRHLLAQHADRHLWRDVRQCIDAQRRREEREHMPMQTGRGPVRGLPAPHQRAEQRAAAPGRETQQHAEAHARVIRAGRRARHPGVRPYGGRERPQREDLEQPEDQHAAVRMGAMGRDETKKAIGPAPQRGADPILLPAILCAVPGPDPWRSAGLSIRKILGRGRVSSAVPNEAQVLPSVVNSCNHRCYVPPRASSARHGVRRHPAWLPSGATGQEPNICNSLPDMVLCR